MTASRRKRLTVRMTVLVAAAFTALAWASSAFATHAAPGTKLWGYEAGFTSRILQYDIGTDKFDTSCVPQGVPVMSNGRGIAFDPRLAPGGGLWITRLTGFTGDGLIHKVTLPPLCASLGAIPFGDGPGGRDPDDIGALDLDPDTGNLFAAEYLSGLFPKDAVSTLFEVDTSTGAILRACNLPTANGDGNDTLAVVKNPSGLPPGKYLVTDNGEFSTPTQFVIPVTSMGPWSGPASAPKCQIAAMGNTPGGRTGIDFEDLNNDMIATDTVNIYDHDGFPWGTTQAVMSAAPSATLEDITLAVRLITPGCKVTYGGRITAMNGDKATFGGNAKVSKEGDPQGQEEYQDHGPADPMNVHSINVSGVFCNDAKTEASIFGEATIDGSGSFNYVIDVKDLGEPGRADTYRIRLSNGYDSGEQTLEGGNVQIHK